MSEIRASNIPSRSKISFAALTNRARVCSPLAERGWKLGAPLSLTRALGTETVLSVVVRRRDDPPQPTDHHVPWATNSVGPTSRENIDTDINLYSKATIGSDHPMTSVRLRTPRQDRT